MIENSNMKTVKDFWALFDDRKYRDAMDLLHEDFEAYWVCTKERFNSEDFIHMNEDYPGRWRTVIERIYPSGDQIITFVHVFSPDSDDQYYASSIFTFDDEKIIELEEYWSNLYKTPGWRQ